MMQNAGETSFILDPKQRRAVWSHLRRHGWVDGVDDGSLLWNDQLPGPIVCLVQDLFFGLPVPYPQCRMLAEMGYAPFSVMPAQAFEHDWRVGMQRRAMPRPKTCNYLKAIADDRRRSVHGYAVRNGSNSWEVVLTAGAVEVAGGEFATMAEARRTLLVVPGVAQVLKIYL